MFGHCPFTPRSPYPGRRNTQEIPPLGTQSAQQGHEGSERIFVCDYMWCGTTSGMTRNLQYLSTVDMHHKRCKNGPERPPIYIVQATPVHIVSYFIYYLARVRAVGFVTGPHARPPRTHSQWVVGPGRRPERTGGRGWESA